MQDSADVKDTLDQVSFVFSELDDFRDFNKPQAVGCLMKAVCVFTKLIEFNDQSLHEQLNKKLNGSLEICTWTGLPQGSGLGTSSILVGCVLKVVWFLMGIEVSNETLSYSTLLVEQLMTTSKFFNLLYHILSGFFLRRRMARPSRWYLGRFQVNYC